ncbi:MAG: hypothetical protein FWC79_07630 [Oscillospiraceae bacterium]|nr:hypothetical protein [Oscillospiraceae bacterium]
MRFQTSDDWIVELDRSSQTVIVSGERDVFEGILTYDMVSFSDLAMFMSELRISFREEHGFNSRDAVERTVNGRRLYILEGDYLGNPSLMIYGEISLTEVGMIWVTFEESRTFDRMFDEVVEVISTLEVSVRTRGLETSRMPVIPFAEILNNIAE